MCMPEANAKTHGRNRAPVSVIIKVISDPKVDYISLLSENTMCELRNVSQCPGLGEKAVQLEKLVWFGFDGHF